MSGRKRTSTGQDGPAQKRRAKDASGLATSPPSILDALLALKVPPKEHKAFEGALKSFYSGSGVLLNTTVVHVIPGGQGGSPGRFQVESNDGDTAPHHIRLVEGGLLEIDSKRCCPASRAVEVAYSKLRSSFPPLADSTGSFVILEDFLSALLQMPALATVVGIHWAQLETMGQILKHNGAYLDLAPFGCTLATRAVNGADRTVIVKGAASRRLKRLVQPTVTSQPMLRPAPWHRTASDTWPTASGLSEGATVALGTGVGPPTLGQLLEHWTRPGGEQTTITLAEAIDSADYWAASRGPPPGAQATEPALPAAPSAEPAAKPRSPVPRPAAPCILSSEEKATLPVMFHECVTDFDRGLLAAVSAVGIKASTVKSAVQSAIPLLPQAMVGKGSLPGIEGSQLVMRTTIVRLLNERHSRRSNTASTSTVSERAPSGGGRRGPSRPWPRDLAVGYNYKKEMSSLLRAFRSKGRAFDDYDQKHFDYFREHGQRSGASEELAAAARRFEQTSMAPGLRKDEIWDRFVQMCPASQPHQAPPSCYFQHPGTTVYSPTKPGYHDAGYRGFPNSAAFPAPRQNSLYEGGMSQQLISAGYTPQSPVYTPQSPTYSPSSPTYASPSLTYAPEQGEDATAAVLLNGETTVTVAEKKEESETPGGGGAH